MLGQAAEQPVGRDRQLTDTHPGGMPDRIEHRPGRADDPDLADPLRADGVELVSGTLKAFWPVGVACASSASAAAPNEAAVAGRPRSAASARVTRQGFAATPPRAKRTSVRMPSCTTSTAATDTSANAYDARSRTLR